MMKKAGTIKPNRTEMEDEDTIQKGLTTNPKAISLAKKLTSNQNEQIEAYRKKVESLAHSTMIHLTTSGQNTMRDSRENLKVKEKIQSMSSPQQNNVKV